MINECDISQDKASFCKTRAQKVIDTLQRRKMNGYYALNRPEALSLVIRVQAI
jgi:hypothetical protein